MELQKKFGNVLPFVLNETVEKDGKRQYQEIARIDMPYPTLADFDITAEQDKDEKGQPKFEDGVPVYVNSALDWLQFAIVQQLKAQNRNKFVAGKLKEGNKLPENFEELVTVGERSGEALKARHECRAAFAAYLKSLNKPEGIAKLLSNLLTDADSIALCQDKFAVALENHITKWVPSLTEENKVRFARTLEKAIEAINSRKEMLNADLS